MTIAIISILLGLAYAAWKYVVIRYAARDIYNGGGVPVLDFVVIPPALFGFGIGTLLAEFEASPFPSFGAVVFVTTGVLLYSLMRREYRVGEPIVAQKIEAIKNQKKNENGA